MGGSVARPALGASLQHLRRREARLRAVLARETARQRQGPPARRAHGRAAARPSRRPAHDRPRGWSRARHRQLAQVRRDDRHGRDPLGRRPGADRLDRRRCRRSTRPTPAASSPDATSTSSARPRLTASPAGPGSRVALRQPRSPRSRDRCCRSGRHSATSGCSRTTSRRCAPPRPPPRPRACCRAAMPTSCSTEPSASFSSRGADQRERLWTSRVWPGALLVDGEIRGTWRRANHVVRIDTWARLSRRTARRDRGRGRRSAAAGARPGDRSRLERVSRASGHGLDLGRRVAYEAQ